MGKQALRQESYLARLRADPTDYIGYDGLAGTLSGEDTVTLPDGRVMGKRALYLEVIKCKPTYADAYKSLADTLGRYETLTLPDGRVLDQSALRREYAKVLMRSSFSGLPV